jgi:hypothetical protein
MSQQTPSNIADTVNKTTIKRWVVDGKTYAPTTIMKNVTSGTVILEDRVLLHIFHLIRHMTLYIQYIQHLLT